MSNTKANLIAYARMTVEERRRARRTKEIRYWLLRKCCRDTLRNLFPDGIEGFVEETLREEGY